MLRRRVKTFAQVVGFVVLFIFFVRTTQFATHSYSSVLTIDNVGRDGERLNIDRSLLVLEAQTQHHLLNTSNNRLRSVLLKSATNTTKNKRRENYNANPKSKDETYSYEKVGEIKQRHPTVIILGVKKAGTRALLDILRMHPKVVGAIEEIYFFNGHYHKGLEWYREQMPLSLPDQITIEKSPTYFSSTEKVATVERMYRFSRVVSGELKLLVVVRDPTERAISDYTDIKVRLKRREDVEIDPIETYVLNKERDAIDNTSDIVKFGIYARYLEKWVEYFTMKQIHFVSGEALAERPFEEIVAVEKFLNLNPHFTEKHFYFSKRKGFPCFIPNPSKAKKRFCLPANKGRKHSVISSRTVQLLREFYRPYNEYFYKIIDRNFNWP